MTRRLGRRAVARRRGAAIGRRALLLGAGRAALGAAGLALVGCGDDGDEREAVVGQTAPSVETPVPSNDEPSAPPAETEPSDPAPAEVAEAPPSRRLLAPDVRCESCTLVDPSFTARPGARALFGVLNGAAYRIEVPARWNGTLLLWARGFGGLNAAGTGFDPVLDFDNLPFRDLLLAGGVAWAASTYRANGFVPAVGVDDLLAVKDIFSAAIGEPSRTLVAGGSMGGATAQLMAQEFPEAIDGALALCGALSNVEVVDYLASWHAVALWLIGAPPERTDADGLVAWSVALGVPDGRGGLALSEAGEQFVAVMRALTGGARWAFDEGLAEQWELNFRLGAIVWPALSPLAALARSGAVFDHDGLAAAFDTTRVVYASDPPAAVDTVRLNAEVLRWRAPASRRDDPAFGPASGRLEVPLLTLKGTGDLFTPISLDRAYLARVRAAGDEDNLVMRAVRRAGHCDFSATEAARAFIDLMAWIESGDRPAGDDLSEDLSGVGVAFTSPFDAGDPLAR